MDSVSFLRWFSPAGPWVLTAIATDRKSIQTRTFSPDAEPALRAWLDENNGRRNVYFQVNPPTRDLSKKAEREDVASLSWLHVDIDPRIGEELSSEHERALRVLREPPGDIPPPSCIIFSGGGYQGFWRLREPLPLNGQLDAAEDAKRWNITLEIAFGGDHCHNVDRIMRLPGTVNIPDEKKRKKGRVETLATVTEVHDDRVYDLSQFTQAPVTQMSGAGFSSVSGSTKSGSDAQVRTRVSGNVARLGDLAELDQWGVSDRVKIIIVQGQHPDETKAGDNSRSAWVFDVCCQLVRANVPDDVIYSVLTDPDYAISESILDKGANADKYAIRQIERAKEDAIHPVLRELNERFAIIGNMGGKCRVIEEVPDPVLNRPRLTRQSYDDFRNRFNRVLVPVPDPANPGQVKNVKAGKWWLEHPQSRYYDHLIFSPKEDRAGCYNLWRGYGVTATPGDRHLAFLDHTLNVVCRGSQAHYDYLMGWLARSVQEPWLPGEVAVVLRGGRGAGKGSWATWAMGLWGRHALQVSNPGHLVGNFNSHLRDCVFLFADEAFFAGDKRHESVLKTLITERNIMIEGKGVDAEMQPNFIHMLMASNDSWVVPAGMDERRYFVLDVSDERKNDHAYFTMLAEMQSSGGLENLLHHLLAMDLSKFNVRSVPGTEALKEQKLFSMSPEDEWWYHKLQMGIVLPGHMTWEPEVPCDALHNDYIAYVRDTGVMRRATSTSLGRFLKRACPDQYPRSFQRASLVDVTSHDGFVQQAQRRTRWYELPRLEVARRRFEERFGFAGDWDAEPAPPSEKRKGEAF